MDLWPFSTKAAKESIARPPIIFFVSFVFFLFLLFGQRS